jgi:hypothetical protein
MTSLNPSFSAAARAVASLVDESHKRPSPRPINAHNDSLFSSSHNLKSPSSFSSDDNKFSSSDIISCYQNIFFTSHKGRKPSQGREIKPSPFRPLVPAKERLFFWRTPYGEQHFFDMAKKLPLPLASAACLMIRSALVPATATTYAAGMKRFTQFCDQWYIPECDRMPASYALLSAFVASYIGKEAGKTIKTWLSGIHGWHTVNHAPWYGDDKWVHLCRSIANREGTSHEKPLRPPVSLEHLYALQRALDLTLPFHAAVWAVALVTFFGCRRLGEITVLNLSSFNPMFNVMRSSNPIFRTLRDGTHSMDFHIPWTKTTREKGADVILTARSDSLCPCVAVLNHFMVNNKIPSEQPLFSYELPHGAYRALTKQDFLSFVNKIWSNVGLLQIHGHSFRIGGAVELLLAGVPPEVVAAIGGWTSLAFLLYWRRLREILPMSTARAYRQSDIDHLSKIFDDFRVRRKIPQSFLDSFNDILVF